MTSWSVDSSISLIQFKMFINNLATVLLLNLVVLIILCTGCTGAGWTFRLKDFTVSYGGASVSTTVEIASPYSTNDVFRSRSTTNIVESVPK